MSWLLFERPAKRLLLFPEDAPSVLPLSFDRLKKPIGIWPAHNEVIRSSVGKWPQGYYKLDKRQGIKRDGFRDNKIGPEFTLNHRQGSQGVFQFADFYDYEHGRRRTLMQIHSGRWASGDQSASARRLQAWGGKPPTLLPTLSQAQRMLSMEPTNGCIRTTEAAIIEIRKQHRQTNDPLQGLWIVHQNLRNTIYIKKR